MTRCPVCGADAERIVGSGSGGGGGAPWLAPWETRDQWTFAAGASVPEGAELERSRPVRAPRYSDVAVTLMWAVCSFLVFLIAGFLLFALTAEKNWLVGGVVVGLVFMVAVWLLFMWDSQKQLWETDRMSRKGAGQKEAEPSESIEVVMKSAGPTGRVYHKFDLPVSKEKMGRVAAAVHAGASFSRPSLSDEWRVLSQVEYNKLAQEMEKRGLLARSGNNRELTATGWAFLDEF